MTDSTNWKVAFILEKIYQLLPWLQTFKRAELEENKINAHRMNTDLQHSVIATVFCTVIRFDFNFEENIIIKILKELYLYIFQFALMQQNNIFQIVVKLLTIVL